MFTVELKLSGLTASEMRLVAASLASQKDNIATYNNGASMAPHWAPIVHCEGPELFGLYSPVVPASVALNVLFELRTAPWAADADAS